ncbi:hypothetical protein B0H14DRAFT_2686526 [Mycena olivaceomarginata]|nr:hypothetical protein B0H14DRAFT_2686526 [Mycena olivaceomarginata]
MAKVAGIPFLPSLCSLTLAIVSIVQPNGIGRTDIKSQREKCLTHGRANPPGALSASGSVPRKIGRFLKQAEIKTQLDACEVELARAHKIFMIQIGVGVASALVDLNIDTEARHNEFLELLSARSGSFDTNSSIRRSSSSNRRSENLPHSTLN